MPHSDCDRVKTVEFWGFVMVKWENLLVWEILLSNFH